MGSHNDLLVRSVVACLLIVGMTAAILDSGQALVATHAESGQQIGCWPLSDDDTFAIIFTNSLFGGDVVETYRLGDDDLERLMFWTQREAAAEYYAYDRLVFPDAMGYVVDLPPFSTTRLVVRVDEIGDHRLRLMGDERSLMEIVDVSTPVVFQAGTSAMCR